MILKVINQNIKNFDWKGFEFWDDYIKEQSIDSIDYLLHQVNESSEYPHKVQGYTIEDAQKDKKSKYYFFYHTSPGWFLAFNGYLKSNPDFKCDLLKILTLPNVKIIFTDPHESVNHDDIISLFESMKSRGIDVSKILYINNDLYLPELSKSHGFIGRKWNHLVQNTSVGLIKYETKFNLEREFVFLCKNKMVRDHRLLMLSCLLKNNLLDFSNYSMLDISSTPLVDDIDESLQKSFSQEITSEFSSFMKKMLARKMIELKYETNSIKYGEFYRDYASHLNPMDYECCFVNILNETNLDDGFMHISEKSLKPFVFYQLPLFFASPLHVKHLREYYGFDMFDDFIDHSYDLEIDNSKRFKLLESEIVKLYKKRNELKNFFEKNKNRFIHNREIVRKISNIKHNELVQEILDF